MQLIVGASPIDCEDWRIYDVASLSLVDVDGTEPLILWPASYWPEIEALVEFDAERQRLKLPRLDGAAWQ